MARGRPLREDACDDQHNAKKEGYLFHAVKLAGCAQAPGRLAGNPENNAVNPGKMGKIGEGGGLIFALVLLYFHF